MGTVDFFSQDKATEAWSWPLPSNAEVMNGRRVPTSLIRLHEPMLSTNWLPMTPSIATKFQYVNSLLFSLSLTTCFGPYGPSSVEIYN
jgi:hypothetical protein